VKFTVHPLLAIEHYIANLNSNGSANYPRYQLFNDYNFDTNTGHKINPQLLTIKDVDIPNYEDLHCLVQNTVEHFKTEIGVRKLSGKQVSPWLETVGQAIRNMDDKLLCDDHLRAVCKLVSFYLYDQDLINTANSLHLDSIKEDESFSKKFHDLSFIKNMHSSTQRQKDTKGYLFATKSNHLLQVNIRDSGFSSAVDTILAMNKNKVSLDINAGSRIMYNNNFGYLVSYGINEVTA
jgi:hypothetical protein